jgi:diadenosine tetraphosphate (Ap4A) HIT family hydrolase
VFRYRSSEKTSNTGKYPDKCPLCHLTDPKLNPRPRTIFKETEHYYVLNALYPYDLWEFREVVDHLMVIPKRHVGSLGEMTPEERAAIMDVFCEYEAKDYNVYARPTVSTQRTIPKHQHTHLIKTSNDRARAALYLKNPYFLLRV